MQEPTPGRMIDAIERATRSRDEFLKLFEIPPEIDAMQNRVSQLSAGLPSPDVTAWSLAQDRMVKLEPNPTIDLMRQQSEREIKAQQLKQETLEYVRRNALASEAALAAALERAEKAERRAAQAEKEKEAERVEKMAAKRGARISNYFAGASFLVAAWQLIERFL